MLALAAIVLVAAAPAAADEDTGETDRLTPKLDEGAWPRRGWVVGSFKARCPLAPAPAHRRAGFPSQLQTARCWAAPTARRTAWSRGLTVSVPLQAAAWKQCGPFCAVEPQSSAGEPPPSSQRACRCGASSHSPAASSLLAGGGPASHCPTCGPGKVRSRC